ncbi:hypothetical protein KJ762_01785 [bacterium]|nr:hypothetical protein [bacterium]MBU1063891.1 hypothetical protein [bacterium]MBU1633220.1 hypothetical protein [bacterium]
MKINVSIGEIVDKLTILSIKIDKFKSPDKLANVKKEYDILSVEIEKSGIAVGSEDFNALKEINLKLWQIEDAIRVKESNREFDDEFIKLARSVYFTNDERAAIKKRINLKFNSDLIEEKEYVDYT